MGMRERGFRRDTVFGVWVNIKQNPGTGQMGRWLLMEIGDAVSVYLSYPGDKAREITSGCTSLF